MDKFTEHLEKANWLEKPVEPIESLDNKTSVITRVLHIPLEDEKYFIQFGEDRQKFHLDITEQTGANLKLNFIEDQGLYITVSGNSETVIKAQKEIFAWLQKYGFITNPMPPKQHCLAICNTSNTTKHLEQNDVLDAYTLNPYSQKICINSVGTNEVMKIYPYEDLLMSTEQYKCIRETLNKKKEYHSLTAGSNSKTINSITQETVTNNRILQFSTNEIEMLFNRKNPQVDHTEPYVKAIFENTNEKTTDEDVEMNLNYNFTTCPDYNLAQKIIERRGEISCTENISDYVTHQVEPENSREIFTGTYWNRRYYIFSTVWAPSWLHKFIFGKKGQRISKITQVVPNVQIDFTAEDKIIIKGPKDDVNYAQEQIDMIVKDLFSRMDYAEFYINYTFYKYLVENNGTVINRIKEKNDVYLLILPDKENNNLMRIEGEFLNVQQAQREVLELAAILEKEHTKDLIIEQKYHHKVIGRIVERIYNIRQNFPNVIIHFPNPGEKSDIIQLRGPKHELEKCTEYLENVVTAILESSYAITVPLFKHLHKLIIGKGGENIKKICLASNTRISFPTASSNSENIVIFGKPENCEIAHKMILSIQKEIANISEAEISISSDLHKSLVDPKECLIGSVMSECGKIHITFPKNDSGLQKVIIRGPAEGVEKAKKMLLLLEEEKQSKIHSVALHVKPQYHQFLLNKTYGNISKICNETGAHITFPTREDRDQEWINITGTEKAVNDAQMELEALIEDLQNDIEDNMLINPKYHHYFTTQRARVLQEITAEYGGVIIRFPRLGESNKRVTLKGAKPCVEAAKKHIEEIIGDMEAKVTIECVIPQKFHSFLMGPMCSQIQQITRDYNVQIKFPDREENSAVTIDPSVQEIGKEIVENTDYKLASISPKECDIILISGRKEKCEAAMKAIESLIPITAVVQVPSSLHRHIVGQKGSRISKITNEFDVKIQVSRPGVNSDIIFIKGPAEKVEQAKAKLQEIVNTLHTEIEDRTLRNFKLMVTIDPKYHSKIIGYKGKIVSQICLQYNVSIHFPNKESNLIQDQIIITGHKNDTLAAQDAIMKLVCKNEKKVTKCISLNPRVHSRIIGVNGKSIQKIMEQFRVDIHFPPKGTSNANITVTGLPNEVKKAIGHILKLEQYFLPIIKKQESQQ
ncbi:Vigilin [Fukomys damarensis]|uniref:Vigilin n=1 Tax=Fukomys damarensis TaxID=885580 RepID=A0A091DVZ6_FUKDA|nr:Vigilin [Fukomys damarensis]